MRILFLTTAAAIVSSLAGQAEAQYPRPRDVAPVVIDRGHRPPSLTVPPFVPNPPVARYGSGYSYWDPYRGWVTHSRSSTVLRSALSPGRAPAPGSGIEHYRYWDGTRWVSGRRWVGQDGQWHGHHSETRHGPNGSTSEDVIYFRAPSGPGGDRGR